MSSERSKIDDLRIDRGDPAEESTWMRWVWIVLVVLLLSGMAFGAWQVFKGSRPEVKLLVVREESTTDAAARTVLNAPGYVTARRQATVSSKVTGKVTEVLIEEGMKVEQNQILARLDMSNTDANVDLAEAQLASANAALAETQARSDQAQLEWKRTRDLARDQIASQSSLDAAEAEAKSLTARLDRLRKDVVVAERQVALWKQEAEDRIIRAPFAGVVVAKNAQPGEMISPISAGGGFTRTGIGTIVDMSSLEIEVEVNESMINRVEANQKVMANLYAYPDWQIPGHVIAIIPAADRDKATVKVRIGFEKLDPRILPDMGVKVAFRMAATDKPQVSGVTIPAAAVRQSDGRNVVLVVADGRVEKRAITLGAPRHDAANVVAGLSAGEKVIIEGPPTLKAGDRVAEKKQ